MANRRWYRSGWTVGVALAMCGCSETVGYIERPADMAGEVVAVQVAFTVGGPDALAGTITLGDSRLACDVYVRVTGASDVRDANGQLSLMVVEVGSAAEVWTRDPAECGVEAEATVVRIRGGPARRRVGGGA